MCFTNLFNFHINQFLDDDAISRIVFKQRTEGFLLFGTIPVIFEIVVYQLDHNDSEYEVIIYPVIVSDEFVYKTTKPYCMKCNVYVDLCKGRFSIQQIVLETTEIEFEYSCKIRLGDNDGRDATFVCCGDERLKIKTTLSNND